MMMAAILNSANLNSTYITQNSDSILVFSDWNSFILIQLDDANHLGFPAILHRKNFTHSFWLHLMMAAILKYVMLDSDTTHLGFRHLVIISQIHSKTLSLQSDFDSN